MAKERQGERTDLKHDIPANLPERQKETRDSIAAAAGTSAGHLDESQRGMIAARLANLRHGLRSDRQDSPIGLSTHTQSEAAALLALPTSTGQG